MSGLINGSFKHSNVQEKNGNKSRLTAAVSVVVAISDRKYLRKRKILAAKTRNLKRAGNIKERTAQGTDDHNFSERQAS